VIEAVVDLSNARIPSSGFFVVAEATFSLGTPQLISRLDFENEDDVTHLLVRDLSAVRGDDLDLDDDGVLDRAPWSAILDAVALVSDGSLEPTPGGSTEWAYALGEVVGPGAPGETSSGSRPTPAHVFRCPDASGPFVIGRFDLSTGFDSPGAANACDRLEPIDRTIAEIQGSAHRSPLEGFRVRTRGVVTGVDASGFYLQDPHGDGAPDTSEGLFVFTRERPAVRVGDSVEVSGSVEEFTPGGLTTRSLSVTEIRAAAVATLGRDAPLPPAVVVGTGGRLPPRRVFDDDALTLFDPVADGLDFFESLEGMRVMLRAPRVVGPTAAFGASTVVVGAAARGAGLSQRGVLSLSARDFNPERIALRFDRDLVDTPAPPLGVGDRARAIVGVLAYAFGRYELRATAPPSGLAHVEPVATRSHTPRGGLRIASFNVRNLDPNDGDGDRDRVDGRFRAVARIVADDLRSPELVALQEVQDDDGSEDTPQIAAAGTLAELIEEIVAAGGPRYVGIDHPFLADDASGGQPGGNIRVAYLYDPDRIERVPGPAEPVVDPIAQRSDPANPFFRSRPPLAVRFRHCGRQLLVVNVHLTSKGGSAPTFGRLQPVEALQGDPRVNGGVDARLAQVRRIGDFVALRRGEQPEVEVVVLGDFNDYAFSPPLEELGRRGLVNLTWRLPPRERYSFVFEGNGQAIDHVLVSRGFLRGARFDVIHANSERPDGPERASDHDPVVAWLDTGVCGGPTRPASGDEGSAALGGGGASRLLDQIGDHLRTVGRCVAAHRLDESLGAGEQRLQLSGQANGAELLLGQRDPVPTAGEARGVLELVSTAGRRR